jgi:hypothetical protein
LGSDPFDAESVPNPNDLSIGEVEGIAFSVLNTSAPMTGVTLEAEATTFSLLNLAGVTGGQPLNLEADGTAFSVLNTASTSGTGQSTVEADANPFSALNLVGVTGGQPNSLEVSSLDFSVLNTDPAAHPAAQTAAGSSGSGVGAGGGQALDMEADGIAFSVKNLAANAPAAAIQASLSTPNGLSPSVASPKANHFLESRPLTLVGTLAVATLGDDHHFSPRYWKQSRRSP